MRKRKDIGNTPNDKIDTKKDNLTEPIKIPTQLDMTYIIEHNDDIYMPNSVPGQNFHIYFDFVRGSQSSHKDKKGHKITSKDGYNSYFIIINRRSIYVWILLTSSKHPPIYVVQRVLQKFKSKIPHRIFQTDQGGELSKCQKFSDMIAHEEYNLKLIGVKASNQNGIAEAPKHIYTQMMQYILYSSNLGQE